jgi:SH3-like domain-containing protein
MEFYILKMILIVIGVIQYARNRIAATKTFNDYYKRKRRQFPWLDNWIKEKRINPSRIRGNSAANTPLIGAMLAYFGIAYVGGIIVNFIIRSITTMVLMSMNLIPNDIEEAIYMNIGQVIAIIIAVVVSQKIWNEQIKKPSEEGQVQGLTLECPKCHCPHSWVELARQYSVEGKSRTTTTTTRVRESDGATTRSESSKVSYYGKSTKDFKCLNCNHTHRGNYDETWDEMPSEKPVYYDPPLPAWEVKKGILSNIINVAIIIAMFTMANNTISGYVNYLKINAEQVEEAAKLTEDTDPALNAIISRRYSQVTVWAEPNKESKEVMTIPPGVFFTKGKKSGRFTEVEYQGKKGWAVSQSVKDLKKGHLATVNKARVYMGDQPNENANVESLFKGTNVIMLGENVNNYVKIEYDGKVYWIRWGDIDW